MHEPKQHRVVHIRNALPPLTQRRPQQRRRVMQVHPVHVGTEEVGKTVVRGRSGVERAKGEVRDVFVDLLGDEGDVEEELWR
jgi:hypothetical protein